MDYELTIAEIKRAASIIGLEKSESADGRIDSAMKETPYLNDLKQLIMTDHPDWDVQISPPRASCDIMVNSVRINLKLTDCKSSDNSMNKPSIFYSITGLTNYPYSSNWKDFRDRIQDAGRANQIKHRRHKPTEYHYLVKNKITGEVLLKPIFDIHTYVSNPSNDLQINWKNEFINSGYYIDSSDDEVYMKKVEELLLCIQKSVKDMIERSLPFAEADIASLLRNSTGL
jgi:hypothetical protein